MDTSETYVKMMVSLRYEREVLEGMGRWYVKERR